MTTRTVQSENHWSVLSKFNTIYPVKLSRDSFNARKFATIDNVKLTEIDLELWQTTLP